MKRVILCAISAFMLLSCASKSERNELQGTWGTRNSSVSHVITFASDGQYSELTTDGVTSYMTLGHYSFAGSSEGELRLYDRNVAGEYQSGTLRYSARVIGNKLYLIANNNMVEYNRQ